LATRGSGGENNMKRPDVCFFSKLPKKLAQEIPLKFVRRIQNNIKITQMDTRGAKKNKELCI